MKAAATPGASRQRRVMRGRCERPIRRIHRRQSVPAEFDAQVEFATRLDRRRTVALHCACTDGRDGSGARGEARRARRTREAWTVRRAPSVVVMERRRARERRDVGPGCRRRCGAHRAPAERGGYRQPVGRCGMAARDVGSVARHIALELRRSPWLRSLSDCDVGLRRSNATGPISAVRSNIGIAHAVTDTARSETPCGAPARHERRRSGVVVAPLVVVSRVFASRAPPPRAASPRHRARCFCRCTRATTMRPRTPAATAARHSRTAKLGFDDGETGNAPANTRSARAARGARRRRRVPAALVRERAARPERRLGARLRPETAVGAARRDHWRGAGRANRHAVLARRETPRATMRRAPAPCARGARRGHTRAAAAAPPMRRAEAGRPASRGVATRARRGTDARRRGARAARARGLCRSRG